MLGNLLTFVIAMACTSHVLGQETRPKHHVESWVNEKISGYVEQTEMAPPEYCHALVQSNPLIKFRCVVVLYRDKRYITLNQAESNPAMELERAENNEGCDNEGSAYSDEFWLVYHAYLKSLPDPEAKKASLIALQSLAAQPIEKYKRFLNMSSCRNARVATANMLPHSSVCRTAPELAETLMLDSDWSVRNSAAQCAAKWVATRDLESQKRVVDIAFRQLTLPHHTDRNKAIGLIEIAATKNTDVALYISQHYLADLAKITKTAKVPNVLDPATRTVLAATQAAAGGNAAGK